MSRTPPEPLRLTLALTLDRLATPLGEVLLVVDAGGAVRGPFGDRGGEQERTNDRYEEAGLVRAEAEGDDEGGAGEPAVGRLLLLDALTMEWRSVKYGKDTQCAVCGNAPAKARN